MRKQLHKDASDLAKKVIKMLTTYEELCKKGISDKDEMSYRDTLFEFTQLALDMHEKAKYCGSKRTSYIQQKTEASEKSTRT